MELIALFLWSIAIGGSGLFALGVVWWLTQRFHKARAAAPPPHGASELSPQTTTSTAPSNAARPQPVPPTTLVAKPTPDGIGSVESAEEEDAVEAKRILSKQERAFFWKLYEAVGSKYYIFLQIPLRQLAPSHKYQTPVDLRGMWQDGVLDFVLADPDTLDAVAAIELDDASQLQADMQARDRRKDRFADLIGIPLLRVSSGKRWNAKQLRAEIQQTERTYPLTFLTEQQGALFRALREARDDPFIFPMASLRQIIKRINWLPPEKYAALQNETADFLFAHPKYLSTMLVIECGDEMTAVSEKGKLLSQAKIPWLAVKWTSAEPDKLRDQIERVLQG